MTNSARVELAREIHDGIAQDLVALGYELDLLLAKPDATAESRLEIRTLRFKVDALISKVRREMYALRDRQFMSLQEEISSIAREICVGNENQRALSDRQSCEQRNRWNYQNCVRRANDKNNAKSCAGLQSSCWASVNTYRCDENYRACFVSCGGHITVIKEQ